MPKLDKGVKLPIPSLKPGDTRSRPIKTNRKIYDSKRWKVLRHLKLIDNPFCECKECEGLDTPADMVDHIIPINMGGDPFDKRNIQSMPSHPCHDAKSGREAHGKCERWTRNSNGLKIPLRNK